MERIYSRVEPDRLLHIVFKSDDLQVDGRIDVSPETEGLQVAFLRLKNEQTFKPHIHKERPREIPRTQESWIIMRGIVGATYYDTDGSFLCRKTLQAGDCTITFAGGHNYRAYTSNTRVFETKLGPFVGVDVDKEFISA